MTTVAIICEYNPFHTGHAYHISAAKKASGADTVIGIMSGCFVQRAEPSVVSPVLRASAAVKNGMDAVIQLPTAFSCASGNVFAEGAISILSRIKSVKYLAMGTENDGTTLEKIAELQCAQPPEFTEELKKRLDEGLSYPSALTKATLSVLSEVDEQTLKKPNNLLAVEYIKAIKKLGANITPVFVERLGNGYNDNAPSGEYISATAARSLLANESTQMLAPYIPENCLEELIEEFSAHRVDGKVYDALTVHALRTRDVSASLDCAEGIDKKLSECAARYASLDEITNACKSKRYTLSRIRRICLQTLLGITKDLQPRFSDAAGKLIAIKNTRKDVMKHLAGVAVKNTDFALMSTSAQKIADVDATAGSIYSLITRKNGNIFWDSRLVVL